MVLEPPGMLERINAALPDQVGGPSARPALFVPVLRPALGAPAGLGPSRTAGFTPRGMAVPGPLPGQIRVFGFARATNGFDSRKHCDKRR